MRRAEIGNQFLLAWHGASELGRDFYEYSTLSNQLRHAFEMLALD